MYSCWWSFPVHIPHLTLYPHLNNHPTSIHIDICILMPRCTCTNEIYGSLCVCPVYLLHGWNSSASIYVLVCVHVQWHIFLELSLPDFWDKAWFRSYCAVCLPRRLLRAIKMTPTANLLTVNRFTTWQIYTTAIANDDSKTGQKWGQSYKASHVAVLSRGFPRK